jgi:hypothetical protein
MDNFTMAIILKQHIHRLVNFSNLIPMLADRKPKGSPDKVVGWIRRI